MSNLKIAIGLKNTQLIENQYICKNATDTTVLKISARFAEHLAWLNQ